MGMTLGEKILAAASGKDSVKPGEIVTVNVDYMMSNDGTTHLTVDMFNNDLKKKRIFDTDKIVFVIDHNIPAETVKTAEAHKKMRDFAKKYDIDFYEGKGVCHQIMVEDYIVPGQLVLGADSHTCTYGALGAFGIGVGCTDFLYAMVTGKTWLLVPPTIRFNLTGKLREGIYPRDLILKIIGDIGANGANYKIMEFGGDGIKNMSLNDRLVLTNLAVEAGAKTGLIEADEKVIRYIESKGRTAKNVYTSDKEAVYEKVYNYDLSTIEPVIARPDHIDDVVIINEVEGITIDEAFIGSCNNGRIEELRVAASILKGRKAHPNVRLIISAASNNVYLQALEEGLIDIFIDSGAMIMNSNCSVCWGGCQGVIGEGEVLISTGTRNFKGRAGHSESKVYLGSAATVAASAIAGKITDARKI